MVANINPAGGNSAPFRFTKVGSTLFFRANDGTNGAELFATNSAGTALVVDLNPAGASASPNDLRNINGTLFFSADNGDGNGRQLWITRIV